MESVVVAAAWEGRERRDRERQRPWLADKEISMAFRLWSFAFAFRSLFVWDLYLFRCVTLARREQEHGTAKEALIRTCGPASSSSSSECLSRGR